MDGTLTMPATGVEDKVVLITGGSRGIGFGIARDLLEHGASVVITGRKQDALDAAVADLGGSNVLAIPGSSDDREHRVEAVARSIERFGRIDVLVNNAGTNPQYGPLVDAEMESIRKVLSVNLEAVIGWVQEVWEAAWSEGGTGSVVNIASVGGLRPRPLVGAYNVSKAAVIHLTRQLAVELAPNVRANAVAPGLIKTDFARVLYDGREQEVGERYPLKRIGEVRDVVATVRLLASDESSWMTGQTIVIDGGDRLRS